MIWPAEKNLQRQFLVILASVMALSALVACSDDPTPVDNNPPEEPTLSAPANGTAGVSPNGFLSWSCSDPDGDELSFDVHFGTSNTPSLVSSNQEESNLTLSALSYSTKYFWRIVARDPDGATASSSTWNFTTSADPGGGTETISTPSTPTGPATAVVNSPYQYSSSGASSSLGHNVQYIFDWGDGAFSDWAITSSAQHSWSSAGVKFIRVQARCATHPGRFSSWSSSKQVSISQSEVLLASNGSIPHLSPDGSRVTFVRLLPGATSGKQQSDIWVVDIDGIDLRPLTSTPDRCEFSPFWHPNEDRIAFLSAVTDDIYSFEATRGSMWDVKSDGTELRQVSTYPTDVSSFCFYRRSGSVLSIAVVRDSVWMGAGGSWPNITTFALRRIGGQDPKSAYLDTSAEPYIVLSETPGAAYTVVFNPVNLDEFVPVTSAVLPWPCLSPSGRKIAAGSDGGLPVGIYVMNKDGTDRIQLTTGVDHQPSWSNNTIVFVRFGPGGSQSIYRLTGVTD